MSIGVDIKKPKDTRGYMFCHMSSDDFFYKVKSKEFKIPPIDMAFIDGNHSYEQTMRDFLNVFSLLADNGLILLHDTFPKNIIYSESKYCGDVYKTAEYIRKNMLDKCEIVTIPNHPGLSIIRKCTKQLSW